MLNTRKWFSLVVPLGFAALLVVSPAAAVSPRHNENGGAKLEATMTGAVEVPTGDPDGSGRAEFTLNPGLGIICYEIEVSGIEPPIAAHIHRAPAGVAGPIVVPLVAPTSGSVEACATNVDRDLVLDIIQNPSAYYVNVHTHDFPAGAVRGQLSK
jgi:hypothetical protein